MSTQRILQEVTKNANGGARKDAVEAIESFEFNDPQLLGDNNSCIICLCDYSLNDEVCKLQCGHCFHRECIARWLYDHHTCPFCRDELPWEKSEVQILTFFISLVELRAGNDIIVHVSQTEDSQTAILSVSFQDNSIDDDDDVPDLIQAQYQVDLPERIQERNEDEFEMPDLI